MLKPFKLCNDPLQDEIRFPDDSQLDIIGFTLLYLKMAVMPLVPETKMTDVGKLISLG